MQVTIRLYRQHDMDLVHLYRMDGFRFTTELKKVLVACANGQVYMPQIPDGTPRDGYVPKFHQSHFTLNEKDPAQKEAAKLLGELKKGMRNSFLKALFRTSLPYLPLASFAEGDGMVIRRASAWELIKMVNRGDNGHESYEEENPEEVQEALPADGPLVDASVDLTREATGETPAIAFAQAPPPAAAEPTGNQADSGDDLLFEALSALSH
jgi:hypothetical protein